MGGTCFGLRCRIDALYLESESHNRKGENTVSKRSLCLTGAEKLFSEMLCKAENLPVSFSYNGKVYKGLPSTAQYCQSETNEAINGVFTYSPDDILNIIVNTHYCREFGEMEYTVWFENKGDVPSSIIKDVYALSYDFPGANPLLRSCMGDHVNNYAAYEHDLLKGDDFFSSNEGRATHIVFPYFDLCCGDGGYLIAIGWAGTWKSMFMHHDGVTSVRAMTDVRLNACLMPGEKIRTGLIVILPYAGRNADHATNLWREWFMKYNLPKANAEGAMLEPFTTMCFACDTGLPNSDGSISERYFTWQKTLNKIREERLHYDFRWFDAGWYSDPAGNSVESDWYGTIGSWEIDKEKWPGDSFRESNEACHRAGMKVFVWFEPERVTNVQDLAKNYGYKPEWGISNGSIFTNNIGDEECLAWTLNRIITFMDKHEVDLYREDNNSDPADAWRKLDIRDTEKYSVPRKGINENKCIVGHYRLWDSILDYCAKTGKCTFLDSCASGGGRNDIESMRRSVPMMRSDDDRTTIGMRLSQSSTFPKWIPFHGSCVKDTVEQLDSELGKGPDAYESRASFLPIFNYHEQITQNPEIDFDLMRSNMEEWKSISHLLTRDFYVLTPWHHQINSFSWTAFAYDAPELGESILLAFRQKDSKANEYIVKLPFADNESEYVLCNVDTHEVTETEGKDLLNGLILYLPEPRSSLFLKIKKKLS